jgi:nicotinate phosphoribosyltransferase
MNKKWDLPDRTFWLAKEEEIKKAKTSDIYFLHAIKVLKEKRIDPTVVIEVYVRKLPYSDSWAVVSGIYEVAKLLEGLPLNIKAMEEGEIFLVSPSTAIYEPVMQIEGKYRDFALFENPLLGMLCTSSGVSTRAARVRKAAGEEKEIFSFGSRRVHPALAPLIERAAYIGGFDSVSNILAARLMKKKAAGTMPHSMIQCFGDQKNAWKSFDEVLPKNIPRIALVDTFSDEKAEAIMAFEVLGGKLVGIRLDTPSSRRGDWIRIIEEVKWELKIRGAKKVKIFVSGGLNENSVRELRNHVDGFGVGTSVSNAPVLDFSAKITEIIEDQKEIFRAKKGDLGGKKAVYRKDGQINDIVTFYKNPPPKGYHPLLTDLIRNGRIVRKLKDLDLIRKEVISKIKMLNDNIPKVEIF